MELTLRAGHEVLFQNLALEDFAAAGAFDPKALRNLGGPLGDLGLDPGALGAKLELVTVEPPPARPPGKIIPGDPASAATELARLLREEAKII